MTEKRGLTFDDIWRMRMVNDFSLSPDGTQVACVVARLDPDRDKASSAIWLVEIASGVARQLTAGEASDSQPRWSPDGSKLAFVSNRHEDKPQIFIMPTHGGEPRRVTGMKNGAGDPQWSPDGTHLCFTSGVDSDEQKVPLESAWLEAHKEIDEKSPRLRRVTTLRSRSDGRGYIDQRTHLFLLPASATPEDEPRQLTDGPQDDSQPRWSPDGRVIAFSSNRTANAEHNFVGDIWTIEVESGELRRLTNEDLTALSGFACSPDGEQFAFTAFPEWFSHGYAHAHVWCVSRHGGDERDISRALDENVGGATSDYCFPGGPAVAWSPDSSTVYFVAQVRGYCRVFAVSPHGGEVRPVTEGEVQIGGIAVSPDGSSLICLAAEPARPFEVYTVPTSGGIPTCLTDFNGELMAEVELATPEHLLFAGAGGWQIEGWMLRPPGRSGDCPLVLHVHGGPYGMYDNIFQFRFQAMASAGYASLYLNPRGSHGYGQAFAHAADWGEKDYLDLMAGVDEAIRRGGIDGSRMGVTGVSYGGFMTNWIVGHTNRFRAAVPVNSTSNKVSHHGTGDHVALWLQQEFGGQFWADDAVMQNYLRHSPISYVGNITTPVLLIHSENDYRCPIEQAEQMLTALRARGQTAELIRIPGASHGIMRSAAPRHRLLQWLIAQEWFDRFLAPPTAVEEEGVATVAATPLPE